MASSSIRETSRWRWTALGTGRLQGAKIDSGEREKEEALAARRIAGLGGAPPDDGEVAVATAVDGAGSLWLKGAAK